MSAPASVRLGDVVTLDRKQIAAQLLPYIGMEDIESGTGALLSDVSERTVKSATFSFSQEHVLYGRLRPYLNKVVCPDFAGHCSTEIIPFRPSSRLDRHFLAFCMRSAAFVEAANRTTTGSRMPRAQLEDLLNLEIPLPSLDEQRRIVKVLDEAQQLITEGRASATKIEAACGELTRSALRTQLASFPSRTRVESLASLIDSGVIYLNRGKIISKRDLNASPGDYPVYSSASANNGQFGRYGEFMFDEEAITWSIDGGGTFFHRSRHKFSVTNVGGILRIADLGTVNYRYLYLVLNEHQQTINFDWVRKAHPSVIRGLYNHIPIPPLETQDQIVARIDEIQASVQNLSDTATSRKHLFAHLQSSSLESLIEAV